MVEENVPVIRTLDISFQINSVEFLLSISDFVIIKAQFLSAGMYISGS